MKNIDVIDVICLKARAELEDNLDRFRLLYEREVSICSAVGHFMDRVLDWYCDKSDNSTKPQLLWEMFHEVIDFGDLAFVESFHGFVVHCLLDDDAFRIDWRKPVYTKDYDLIWEKDGNYKTILVDKNDPRAQPVVVRDGDGCQKVSLLLEAMDIKEKRNKERMEEINLEMLVKDE